MRRSISLGFPSRGDQGPAQRQAAGARERDRAVGPAVVGSAAGRPAALGAAADRRRRAAAAGVENGIEES